MAVSPNTHTISNDYVSTLQKKAMDILSPTANKHGLALISAVCFLSLGLISSMFGATTILTSSLFIFSAISGIGVIKYNKMIHNQLNQIITEKTAKNIKNWDIKLINNYGYFIPEFIYTA